MMILFLSFCTCRSNYDILILQSLSVCLYACQERKFQNAIQFHPIYSLNDWVKPKSTSILFTRWYKVPKFYLEEEISDFISIRQPIFPRNNQTHLHLDCKSKYSLHQFSQLQLQTKPNSSSQWRTNSLYYKSEGMCVSDWFLDFKFKSQIQVCRSVLSYSKCFNSSSRLHSPY